MNNIDVTKTKLDELLLEAIPDFFNITDNDRVSKLTSLLEATRDHGLDLADNLIEDCIPLIEIIEQHYGKSSTTYTNYSNRFVTAAITYISNQVNNYLPLTLVSDLNDFQKSDLKNKNTYALSLINRLEKYYREQETQQYVDKIKIKISAAEQRVNPSSSCYIATIVYMDYNSHEVSFLREYRDRKLSRSLFGKIFIKLYYFSSPILKPVVKHSIIIQKMIKYLLDKFIKTTNCNQQTH